MCYICYIILHAQMHKTGLLSGISPVLSIPGPPQKRAVRTELLVVTRKRMTVTHSAFTIHTTY